MCLYAQHKLLVSYLETLEWHAHFPYFNLLRRHNICLTELFDMFPAADWRSL